MKLRNKKSYLNSLPEGNAPENLWAKIVHWSYFLILLALVLYFARYVYYRLASVEGFGQVVVERVVMSASYGGNISHLPAMEEQSINKGDVLVHIGRLKSCQQKENSYLVKLKLETEVKSVRLNALRHQLREINKNQLMHRALELNNRRLNSTSSLQFDIRVLAGELNAQLKLLHALTQNAQAEPMLRAECQDEVITAPFQGVVRRVLKQNFEFVERSEDVVIIESKQASVHIEGYFSKYDLDGIGIGNNISISFPDGKTGLGVINKIDASAYAFAEREWDNYEPSDTRIRVLLTPVDQEQAELWKQYDLLRVQIRGNLW